MTRFHTTQTLTAACHPLHHLKHPILLNQIDSTNDYALELEKVGAASGTTIVTNEQTAGRGRAQRTWLSMPGDCVLSILLRPPLLTHHWGLLSTLPAVAITRTLIELSLPARIKWPNDVVLMSQTPQWRSNYCGNYKKVSGILIENVFRANQVAASIIGIAINIFPNKAALESINHFTYLKEYIPNTTTLHVMERLLHHFDCALQNCQQENFIAQHMDWYSAHCVTVGQRVTTKVGNTRCTGIARGINLDGSLSLFDGNKLHRIQAGEVRLAQENKLIKDF